MSMLTHRYHKRHGVQNRSRDKGQFTIELKRTIQEYEAFKVRCHSEDLECYMALFLLSHDRCELLHQSSKPFLGTREFLVNSTLLCQRGMSEKVTFYALRSSKPLPLDLSFDASFVSVRKAFEHQILTKKYIKTYNISYRRHSLTLCKKEVPCLGDTNHLLDRHKKTFYQQEDHTVVDILYGTDRGYNKEETLNSRYTTQRSQLSFGVAQVSVPKSHVFGKIERPMFRLKREEKVGKDILLYSLNPLEKKAFSSLLNEKLHHIKREDILIFIHGFNVSFAGALRRTAQLVYDLKFQGVALTYSWSSQGSPNKYLRDEVSAQYTIPKLVQFLQEIIKNRGKSKIHILAHSMGTLALSNALRDISFLYDTPQFENIIYAAPDIDVEVFESNFYPYIRKTTKKITVYASSNDKALTASRILHDDKRLGEGGEYISVFEDLITIDVTGIDTSMIGHSYFANKKILLRDLRSVVKESLPPMKRSHLVSRYKNHLQYWEFKQ